MIETDTLIRCAEVCKELGLDFVELNINFPQYVLPKLDAEELNRRVNPIVAEKALSPGERAQYDAAVDKNCALLTFWGLKEAEGKRSGRGVGIHPTHTDFMLTDTRVFECDNCLVAIIY